MKISVQTEDFDAGAELKQLSADTRAGALVSFIGLVRDFNLARPVTALELEHYPGMTERALQEIVEQACARWPLTGVTVIHRVGRLSVTDQIVLVAVGSAHRGAAFSACEFIMDFLKTQAPFWKKEHIDGDSVWLDSRQSDVDATKKWR